MGLKAILSAEEHAKLADQVKGLYSEHGEGYRLDVESVGGWALEDVSGLQSTLSKLKKTNAELKSQTSTLDGFDMEAAKQALERVKALEGNEGKTKEQIEAVRKNMTEAFEKEKAKLSESNASLEKELHQHLVRSAAALALGKHSADADLLMPHIEGSVKPVRGDDGRHALRVLNPDGSEALSKLSGKSSEPMSVEEYVGSVLKTRFPAAFPGSGANGSGAPGSSRTGSGGNGRFTISAEQARDARAFERVFNEAAKAGQQVTIAE